MHIRMHIIKSQKNTSSYLWLFTKYDSRMI